MGPADRGTTCSVARTSWGSRPDRLGHGRDGRVRVAPPAGLARPGEDTWATVGLSWRNSRSEDSTPKMSRSVRAPSCVAMSEWPPGRRTGHGAPTYSVPAARPRSRPATPPWVSRGRTPRFVPGWTGSLKCVTVDLPVRSERQGIERDECRGVMDRERRLLRGGSRRVDRVTFRGALSKPRATAPSIRPAGPPRHPRTAVGRPSPTRSPARHGIRGS